MENLVIEIKKSWNWVGIDPSEVLYVNDFGNIIIKDISNEYWRLCPEEVYCEIIAKNNNELENLFQNQEFSKDWSMSSLAQLARKEFGELKNGYKFSFVIPPILGGKYVLENIKPAPLSEIIGVSGDIGKQIKDLPNGAKIKLKIN